MLDDVLQQFGKHKREINSKTGDNEFEITTHKIKKFCSQLRQNPHVALYTECWLS